MNTAKAGELWHMLDWDTEHLGIRIARINETAFLAAGPGSLERMLKEAPEAGVQYLMGRFNIIEQYVINRLLARSFEIADMIVQWKIDLGGYKSAPPDTAIRTHRPEDIEALQRLSAASFAYDRYHTDSRIDKARADRLHAEWIKNACNGLAEKVLVKTVGSAPAGFISLKSRNEQNIKTGIIDLVAVSPDYRKQRIGQSLVKESLNYFKDTASVVEVGTQITNIPAWQLYQKMGFKLAGTQMTLRRYF